MRFVDSLRPKYDQDLISPHNQYIIAAQSLGAPIWYSRQAGWNPFPSLRIVHSSGTEAGRDHPDERSPFPSRGPIQWGVPAWKRLGVGGKAIFRPLQTISVKNLSNYKSQLHLVARLAAKHIIFFFSEVIKCHGRYLYKCGETSLPLDTCHANVIRPHYLGP